VWPIRDGCVFWYLGTGLSARKVVAGGGDGGGTVHGTGCHLPTPAAVGPGVVDRPSEGTEKRLYLLPGWRPPLGLQDPQRIWEVLVASKPRVSRIYGLRAATMSRSGVV